MSDLNEEWKVIPNWPGYEVSDKGRVRSFKHNSQKILAPFITHNGYVEVGLCKNGKRKGQKVHRLVLTAFVGPCPCDMEACHANGQRDDNRLKNLRWDTRRENSSDRKNHGTWQGGEGNGRALLKPAQVRAIRRSDESDVALGLRYGVSASAVYHARLRHTWRHVV